MEACSAHFQSAVDEIAKVGPLQRSKKIHITLIDKDGDWGGPAYGKRSPLPLLIHNSVDQLTPKFLSMEGFGELTHDSTTN